MTQQINPDLSNEQKAVLFDKVTEAPFTGTFLHNKDTGMYACANCGAALFDSATKFESGSGWPSFYDVAKTGAVKLLDDTSHGMQRTEVICANCGGHLGHLFPDAFDQPTGQRYCINSASLAFMPEAKDQKPAG
jgi:peptide-methionine (R)-S-oxide reductase